MARGWESKSVEAQMESIEAEKSSRSEEDLSQEQIQKLRDRDNLMLSRTRILQDLEASRNARYRKMLEEALAFLDLKLSELDRA